jgi:hypothetical protein
LERKGIDLKGWLAILSNVLLLAMLTAVVAGVVHLSTTKAQLAEVSARLETANAKLSNVDSLLLSIAESKLRALEESIVTMGDRLATEFARTPTWEYVIESPPDSNFQQAIDHFGANGWDLVAARRATHEIKPLFPWNDARTEAAYEIIFKRPKR